MPDTFLDSSSNALVVTANGNVAQGSLSPFYGNTTEYYSVAFDGTGDYLSVADNAAFTLGSQNFTAECWVYPTKAGVVQYVFGQVPSSGTAATTSFQLYITATNKFEVGVYAGAYKAATGTTDVKPNTWYHVAMVRSGGNLELYVNGVKEATNSTLSTTAIVDSSGSVSVARTGDYNGDYFQGLVSDFRVVVGNSLYTSTFTPPTSKLTAISGTVLLTCQSSTFVDNSTNAFTVTKYGDAGIDIASPYVVPGYKANPNPSVPSKYSVAFDGTGDYLTLSSNASMDFGLNPFTIEGWVYTTTKSISAGASRTIIGNAGNSYTMQVYINTSSGVLTFGNTGSTYIAGTTDIANAQWNHFAIVREGTGSNQMKMYVNGVLQATGTNSINYTSSTIYIGSFDASNGFWNGYISNLRIVKGSAVYTSAFTPPTTDLTAITNTALLTCQSSSFIDNSTNAYTVTKTGDAAISTVSPYSAAAGTPSTVYYSGYFDGTGDYLDTPSNAAFGFGTGDFTMECWIYRMATGTQHLIFEGRTAATGQAVPCLYLTSANALNYGVYSPTDTGDQITYATGVVVNTWNHIALCRASGTTRLFLNGIRVGSFSDSFNYATTRIRIGANFNGLTAFNGYISNARIVKGTALYSENFFPSSTALTAVSGTSLLTLQNSTFIDNSTNAFTITNNGNTVTSTYSPFNQIPAGYHSTYFDGTGDYLSVADNASLDMGASNFTIEGWYYPTGNASISTAIFSKRANNSATGGVLLYYAATGLTPSLLVDTGGSWGINTASSIAFTANTWNHFAVVRNGTSFVLFINGSIGVSATSSATIPDNTSSFCIGAMGADGSGAISACYMSNFRVIKGTAVYSAAFTPSTSPLTAVTNTQLLTCNSYTISDYSANNFTVTKNGDTRVSTQSPFYTYPSYVSSNVSTWSGYFDGATDYLSFPVSGGDNFNFGTGDYTIECWINYSGKGSTCNIIDKWNVGGGNMFILRFNSGTTLQAITTNNTISHTANAITTGAWTHIAFVRNNNLHTLYVNGVSVGTPFTATGAEVVPTGNIQIGAGNTGLEAFIGYISNVRIVKGVAVYTKAFTPSTSPLTAIPGTVLLALQDNRFTDNSAIVSTITRSGDTVVSTQSPLLASSTYNDSVSGILSSCWSTYYNGSTDSLSVSNSGTNLDLGTTWTIETWIYPLSKSTQQCILLLNGDTTVNAMGAFRLEIDSATGNWRYLIGNTAGGAWTAANTTASSVDLNTWQHIACVCSAGSFTIYKNGVSIGTVSSVPAITSRSATYNTTVFGKYGNNTTYFNGYLSNTRIVKGAAIYTSAFVPPASGLTNVSGTSLLTSQDYRLVDNSSSAFALTASGTLSTTQFSPYSNVTSGQFSGSFNGTSDYLSIPNNTAFNIGTSDFTMEAWVFISGNSATNAAGNRVASIFSSFPTTGTIAAGYEFLIDGNTTTTGTGLYFSNRVSNVTYALSATATITQGSWNHVAVVRSGNVTTMYLNGTSIGSTTLGSQSITTTNNIALGGSFYSTYNHYLNGHISNFRLVKRALYTSSFTPSTTPLFPVSDTVLLTLKNSTFVDNGPNKLVITSNGSASVSNTGPFTTIPSISYTKAIEGGSCFFDATGDYLSVPSNAALQFGTGDFTIEGWIYPTSVATARAIYDARPASTNGAYPYLYVATDKTIRYYVSTADRITSSAITLNAWYHVVISRTGTSTRMFINGAQAGSTYSDSTNYTASATLIGASYGGGASLTNYFAGYLSNVRAVKGRALYTTNFLPPIQPLTPTANTSLLMSFNNPTFLDHARKNNIEIVGTPSLSQAIKRWGNYSMNFGSSGSNYLNIADNPQMRLGAGDFCVEGWFRPVGSGTRFFYSKGYGTTGGLALGVSVDTVTFRVSGTSDLTATVSLSSSSFTHIAFVRFSGTRLIYVNGTLVASSATVTFDNNDTSMLQIGAIGAAASDTNRYYGYIDDLRVNRSAIYFGNTITVPSAAFGTKSASTAIDSNRLLLNSSIVFNPSTQGDLVLSSSGTYTIKPTSNMNVLVKSWGASGGSILGSAAATGGAGGYASGNLTLVANNTYTFIVGKAGTISSNSVRASGGGGGGTAILLGSTPILVAGGGGGGYATTAEGGAGGGSAGQDAPGGGGKGGSQSAAGAGGVGGRRTGSAGSGTNGGAGAGSGGVTAAGGSGYGSGGGGAYDGADAGGGGGGGGYFGGGGGGGFTGGFGGGGGSGYVHPTLLTSSVNTQGALTVPANSSDADRGNSGGFVGINSQDGKILIRLV